MSDPNSNKVNEESPLINSDREEEQISKPPILATSQFEEKPLKYKVFAFLCSILLSVGSHYASHMLSALKPQIKEELGITNGQYGLLQSATSLVNTIVPFFGGMFIDIFGTAWGSLVASSLIFSGEVIVALSTSVSSFEVMVLGRLIYGMGAGCIVTVQQSILAHWFRGKGLSSVVGVQIAISKLSSFIAQITVVPISENTGFYGNAFWVSAALCGASWCINLCYVGLVYYLGEQATLKQLAEKAKKSNIFKWNSLLKFNLAFWIIVYLSLSFGMTWAPFMYISTELIIERFGEEDKVAAWYASISFVMPIVLSPVSGAFIDMYGKRGWIVLLSAATLVISFYLIGFTYLNPTVALFLFSFSLAMGPMGMITSIPLILPIDHVGTALGVYKCASNIGTTLFSPLTGVIQDYYDSYHQVMIVLEVAAIISVMLSVLFLILDYFQFKGLVNVVQDVRKQLLLDEYIIARIAQCDNPSTALKLKNYLHVTFMAFMLLVSWGLYISITVVSYIDDDENATNITIFQPIGELDL